MTTLTKLARLFGDVREGEAGRVLVLLTSFFLLMAAYYQLKVLREPLVLATGGKELKAYSTFIQGGVLLVAVPLYARLAARVGRDRLIRIVWMFFWASLQLFCLGAWLEVPRLAAVFYVWVGVFNLTMIAQFGSFVNDIYTKGDGERLFPVIWIGATVGAAVGSFFGSTAFKGFGLVGALEFVALLLVLHLVLLAMVQRRAGGGDKRVAREPASFSLVLRSPYLRLVAAVAVLINVVNTTGELMISGSAAEQAAAAALEVLPNGTEAELEELRSAYLGDFYSDFFFFVNVTVVIVQALLVSRLVKFAGFAGAMLALPIVSLGAYGLVAAGAGFAVFRVVKMAENAADYSVMNTARGMLWLPTTLTEKYNGKQVVDTVLVRLGDMFASGLTLIGTTYLAFGNREFAILNLVVIAGWLALSMAIIRRYRAHEPAQAPAPSQQPQEA